MSRLRLSAPVLLLLVIGMVNAAPVAANSPDRVLQWPTEGRLSQEFGCTGAWTNGRRGGCRHFHNGLDIANDARTPIYAAAPGVIRHLGWNRHDPPRQRAWLVVIDHGAGLRTWYAHLQPETIPGAELGSWVAAGQLIGYMGNTGRSTGNHLHLAVQLDGNFVDPLPLLRHPAEIAALVAAGHLWLAEPAGGYAPGGSAAGLTLY